MKTLLTRLTLSFYTWLTSSQSKNDEQLERQIKRYFIWFFQGNEFEEPISRVPMEVCRFEITELAAHRLIDKIEVKITLARPGLLIGKEGRILDDLIAYLERRLDTKVKISIKESKMWH